LKGRSGIFLGNSLPDREARVEDFFLNVAAQFAGKPIYLGGNGWHDKPMSPNISYSAMCLHGITMPRTAHRKAVLNIIATVWPNTVLSPATRVFEAAVPVPHHYRLLGRY
jgi:spore maturation protein CgeB